MAKLSATQTAVLEFAAYRPEGDIEPLPPTLRGGAKLKVIAALFGLGLITKKNRLTDAGYAAVGRKRKVPTPAAADPGNAAAVAATQGTGKREKQDAAAPIRHTRENTKQATVIQMLGRPEGATIRQICDATGWQAHTVRGTFAGAFKKKLGLNLISEKTDQGDRVYRVS